MTRTVTHTRLLAPAPLSLALLFGAVALPGPLGGARASADAVPYTITVQAPAARVGTPAAARVELKPAPGWHVNKDYPTTLKLVAPAGVELPKPTLTRKDGEVKIAESAALFDVPFTAKEAGKKTFDGTLSFAICTPSTCDPRKAKLNFTVEVK